MLAACAAESAPALVEAEPDLPEIIDEQETIITVSPVTTLDPSLWIYTAPEVIPEPEYPPLPPVEFFPAEVINERGNNVGNIINGGRAAAQGDWVYYTAYYYSENVRWDSYLMRSRLDGTEAEPLHQGWRHSINVIGDWVYFVTHSWYAGVSIKKIRTDGTDLTSIVESDFIKDISVVGDWIYYADYSERPYSRDYNISYENFLGSIYKIRTDGTEKTLITDEPGWEINVVDDWVYFVGHDDGFVYKIRTDGTDRTQLNSFQSSYINVVDGWVFYSNLDDNGFLYKMRIDGTENTQLNSDDSIHINVSDGWIFYGSRTYYEEPIMNEFFTETYKMRLDGSEKTKVWGDIFGILIIGDWMYYSIPVGPYAPFNRVRTDGTDRQEIDMLDFG